MTAGSPKTWTSGLVSVADLNEEIRDQFNYIFGAWATYTPLWTNLTPGSASVTARYRKVGRTVHVQVSVVLASDSSVSGSVTMQLPASGGAGGNHQRLSIQYRDNSAGDYLTGFGSFTPSGSYVALWSPVATDDNSLLQVNATHPWTWATSDEIHVWGSYEAAS